MKDTVIFAQELTKTFGSLFAVRGLNLEVKRGELFGLMGPDGAGKTTTIRLLCGLLRITSGRAEVVGLELETQSELLKEKVGYMPQRFALYPDLTVDENIKFHAGLHQLWGGKLKSRKSELLEFSRLTPFKDRLTKHLSGGMKQKLGLCCALIHTPEVIFLDEPTTGVDPVSRRDLWLILYELLQQGVTIFLSTPYMEEAERCNRIAFMESGRVLGCDHPEEIRRLSRHCLYELTSTPARSAKALLEKLSWVRSVVFFGERLRVALPFGPEYRDKLELTLIQEGIKIENLREIPPSLEDVFVFLSQGG